MAILIDAGKVMNAGEKMAQMQKELEATSFSGVKMLFDVSVKRGRDMLSEARAMDLEYHVVKIDPTKKTVSFMIKSEDLDLLECFLDKMDAYKNITSSQILEYNSLNLQRTR